jgi:nucleoside phosphorylase
VDPACDLVLFAAFHPELAPLQAALGDTMRRRIGNVEVVARAAGIGLPMAAAGCAMHLGDLRPKTAIAIGTCGAYAGSGLEIGDVVVARRVRLVDPAALRDESQFPDPMSTVIEGHQPLVVGIARNTRAAPVDVATTLAITVDDAVAARIARATGAAAEHLEAYAIATACAARGVPFCAVLGVANLVGNHAREQWKVHHHEASRAAANVVLDWLRADGLRALSAAP